MHPIEALNLTHKYDAGLVHSLHYYACEQGLPDGLVDWIALEMKNRIVVGNSRYEQEPLVDPDQDRVLPKGWRNGFAFWTTDLDVWRSGIRNKMRAMEKTRNGDLAPDVINYCGFLMLTADCRDEVFEAYGFAIDALLYVANGRDGYIPGYHETALDQGIHGKELSGSANVKPRR